MVGLLLFLRVWAGRVGSRPKPNPMICAKTRRFLHANKQQMDVSGHCVALCAVWLLLIHHTHFSARTLDILHVAAAADTHCRQPHHVEPTAANTAAIRPTY